MTDIFYHNLSLTNTSTSPILAEIIDARGTTILENPSDWQVSVVRFQLDTSLIPLFRPVIPNPVTFPLQTNLSVTLKYGATYIQKYVDVNSTEAKYGVFDYGIMLENINQAFFQAYNQLKSLYPLSPQTAQPYLCLNPETGLISMYVESSYITGRLNAIQIGINHELQQLLDLPAENIYPHSTAISQFEYELAVRTYSKLIPPNGSRYGYPYILNSINSDILEVSQEFSSLGEWSDIKSIIFTTTLLPIEAESVPTIFDSVQNASTTNGSLNIVTDYELGHDNSQPTRGVINYFPSGEYRMADMVSSLPLSSINVTAYAQSYTGKTTEILLGTNTSFTMKLMFRRKT